MPDKAEGDFIKAILEKTQLSRSLRTLNFGGAGFPASHHGADARCAPGCSSRRMSHCVPHVGHELPIQNTAH